MNILSIDYGVKNIGFSVSNFYFYKKPILFIFKKSKFLKNIIKYILNFFLIKLILIGFPVFFKINSISYINLIFFIKKFLINILNTYNVKVKIINEIYSSYIFKKMDHFSSYTLLKNYISYTKVVGFEPTIF